LFYFILHTVLKGDLSKIKKHLKTLKSHSGYQNRQDNKFQQDAQVKPIIQSLLLRSFD